MHSNRADTAIDYIESCREKKEGNRQPKSVDEQGRRASELKTLYGGESL